MKSEKWIKVSEVAVILGISTRRVGILIESGRLGDVRGTPRKRKVKRQAVENLVRSGPGRPRNEKLRTVEDERMVTTG